MSEEILKALTQLFAIITKQDGGVSTVERTFIINFFKQQLDQSSVQEYTDLYDKFVGDNLKKEKKEDGEEVQVKKKKLTSVRDSVKTLAISRKINKTLTQKQKVIVLVKLLELVSSDGNQTEQRMNIINTVSEAFDIDREEYLLVEAFALQKYDEWCNFEGILMVAKEKEYNTRFAKLDLQGFVAFIHVKSVNLYFVEYVGSDEIVLNGSIMKPGQTYLFSIGSAIKTPRGGALYYSAVVRHFDESISIDKVSFNVEDIEFRFPNGHIGLRNVNISEKHGGLIGIMGASGAGKTTLLNTLAGIAKPYSGKVEINGYDIYEQKKEVEGVIGYIAQDDLLIEELTVYQNLYYNAKLCFAKMPPEQLHERVMTVLKSLGLDQRKDLRVGSILDKTISGGQRKRLNIALELIREPAVMFVDEPTSGLSSRDSENVMDLLKELTQKGKIIFVVIHQPSADIYKMFDKMYIMDTGGYPVFYGNPLHAITYFKKQANKVDADKENLNNINPEVIFNIIEEKVVDEYGQLTDKRKKTPEQWHELYKEAFGLEKYAAVEETPPSSLSIPSQLKQAVIFTIRDTLSKVSNRQYMLITFLEAPLLAIFLSFIIKYREASNPEYVFRFNENIPAFFLMAVLVSLFMGLTGSAEEIIRDRKILKRESFLNLSWNSYLTSKVIILFAISAIQTITFVGIGNTILEIREMTLSFWLVLFSVSCFANLLGLNISAAFNSAVTVYILIPLLLIPQMILSGLIFNFDKLNNSVSSKGEVPLIADFMVSRWAYEAMAVEQFKSNAYKRPFFELEKVERQADYKAAYLIPALKVKLEEAMNNVRLGTDSSMVEAEKDLEIVKIELRKEPLKKGLEGIDLEQDITSANFNRDLQNKLISYFDYLNDQYLKLFNKAVQKQEKLTYLLENNEKLQYNIDKLKNKYYNESLADLVRNVNVAERIIEYEGKMLQRIDPIFTAPSPGGILDYRAHFFAPRKHFAGMHLDTFYFNVLVIWFMTLVLYVTLYFESLRKLLAFFMNLKLGKK